MYLLCVLALYTGSVCWLCVLALCTDSVYWLCVLAMCTCSVYSFCVPLSPKQNGIPSHQTKPGSVPPAGGLGALRTPRAMSTRNQNSPSELTEEMSKQDIQDLHRSLRSQGRFSKQDFKLGQSDYVAKGDFQNKILKLADYVAKGDFQNKNNL